MKHHLLLIHQQQDQTHTLQQKIRNLLDTIPTNQVIMKCKQQPHEHISMAWVHPAESELSLDTLCPISIDYWKSHTKKINNRVLTTFTHRNHNTPTPHAYHFKTSITQTENITHTHDQLLQDVHQHILMHKIQPYLLETVYHTPTHHETTLHYKHTQHIVPLFEQMHTIQHQHQNKTTL